MAAPLEFVRDPATIAADQALFGYGDEVTENGSTDIIDPEKDIPVSDPDSLILLNPRQSVWPD